MGHSFRISWPKEQLFSIVKKDMRLLRVRHKGTVASAREKKLTMHISQSRGREKGGGENCAKEEGDKETIGFYCC